MNKEEKLKELESLITNLLIYEIVTEEEIEKIIQKSFEKYKTYINKMLYKKIINNI